MRTRPLVLRTLVAVISLAACTCIAAAVRAPAARAAPAPALSAAQTRYLALAQAGVTRALATWHDARRGWYDARLHDRDRYPLATIWDIVPLFQSLDALAIANPTPANRTALVRFAAGAERYLNHGLHPLPGYSPYPGDRTPNTETWFDDNGWWGIAFVEAARATGDPRYLADALRALRYIAAAGWDPATGGIWWNTTHPYKAGEALASGTLLAVLLYQQTHSPFALAQARRFLTWADTAGFSPANQLYAASNLDPTPIDYIESPLIYAGALLCRLAGPPSACALASSLKATALRRFPGLLDFSPQYDAIYLQWLLALYSLEGDPTLYTLAADNARDAMARAASAPNLYLLSWNGQPLPSHYALPNMLQTDAATLSLFAWLATYPPPSSAPPSGD